MVSARDPNRIFGVLSELFLVWKESPDLRLGQLLCNLAGSDLFYLEDENLIARMRERRSAEWYCEWDGRRAEGATVRRCDEWQLPQKDTQGLGACNKDGCEPPYPSGLLQG